MAYRDSNSTAGSCIAGEKCEKDVYLVFYGSGFLTPTYGATHNTGSMFELNAKARHKINKEKHPDDIHKIIYASTDYDLIHTINQYKNSKDKIVRMDIYSHAWAEGLNMGGFTGEKNIKKKVIKTQKYIEEESYYFPWTSTPVPWSEHEVEKTRQLEVEESEVLYSDMIDWRGKKGTNLRQVTHIQLDLKKIDSRAFKSSQKTYIWGCNAGGQLDQKGKHIAQNEDTRIGYEQAQVEDPKITFAQKLAEKIGGKVYALVGKGAEGGSAFKSDKNGKPIYDGELLPANIAANHNYKNTSELKAEVYLKEFPL